MILPPQIDDHNNMKLLRQHMMDIVGHLENFTMF